MEVSLGSRASSPPSMHRDSTTVSAAAGVAAPSQRTDRPATAVTASTQENRLQHVDGGGDSDSRPPVRTSDRVATVHIEQTASGTPTNARRWGRPPRLDALLLGDALTSFSADDAQTDGARACATTSSFYERCAATTLWGDKGGDRFVLAALVPLHDDMSPDRRLAEWNRLRCVLPCGGDEASVRLRRYLFTHFNRHHRDVVDRDEHRCRSGDGGGDHASHTVKHVRASLCIDDVYRGLVTVLHLNRVSPGLRVLVERGYAEAHTLCVCARRATRSITHSLSVCESDEVVLTEIVVPHDRPVMCRDGLNSRKVTFTEFRLILEYLHDYFTCVTHIQKRLAGATVIRQTQWPSVVSTLSALGMPVSNSREVFDALDLHRRGTVTVDAVCARAAGHKMWLGGEIIESIG